jgi:hypothetical protein
MQVLRETTQLSREELERQHAMNVDKDERMKLALALSKTVSKKFTERVEVYMKSGKYTMHNKRTCGAILSFFKDTFEQRPFWRSNEPHKPDLAAALSQKIDPYLCAPLVNKPTVDSGPARVLWLNTGIPADIVMLAHLYNTLEGFFYIAYPPTNHFYLTAVYRK